MEKVFQGRAIVPGVIEGEVLVTHQPLNLLASYRKIALNKRARKVICADKNNTELFKVDLTNKIICLPQTVGSTTGGIILQMAAKMGIGPKALLFSDHIDSLAAAGIVLTRVWIDKQIITIDQLGKGFLEFVKQGDIVKTDNQGIVKIFRPVHLVN